MNTPAHLAASLLVWKDADNWRTAGAVALGAVLPDLPMFGFYAYQKLWAERPEREIWSDFYFRENWQLFFDLFNSIPLAVVLIVIGTVSQFRWGTVCAASALLHMLCDLPVHHDDGHRHFLPLSNWRFESPLSYWDPSHYGGYFVWVELAFTVGACAFVGWTGRNLATRSVALATLALYAAGIAFAVAMWM